MREVSQWWSEQKPWQTQDKFEWQGVTWPLTFTCVTDSCSTSGTWVSWGQCDMRGNKCTYVVQQTSINFTRYTSTLHAYQDNKNLLDSTAPVSQSSSIELKLRLFNKQYSWHISTIYWIQNIDQTTTKQQWYILTVLQSSNQIIKWKQTYNLYLCKIW